MSAISNNPPPPSENQYQKGINEYRATLKWVVSSFGAVAAALTVGLQVTSLGSLYGWRLYWALPSVTLAFGAVLIYRKLSLGSQSEQGEHRIERLLSASATCRLQQRSLFVYMAELLAAHAHGDPPPTRLNTGLNAYNFAVFCRAFPKGLKLSSPLVAHRI
jgi:membrane protein required for beta-lactamase induction